MTDECYINGKDAYTEWGIIMEQSTFPALLTPPPVKGYVTAENSNMNGAQVLTDRVPYVDKRELMLTFGIKAPNPEAFIRRFKSFMDDIMPKMEVRTRYSDDTYHLLYLSCNPISEYNGKLGKFVLKVLEPDPSNRI